MRRIKEAILILYFISMTGLFVTFLLPMAAGVSFVASKESTAMGVSSYALSFFKKDKVPEIGDVTFYTKYGTTHIGRIVEEGETMVTVVSDTGSVGDAVSLPKDECGGVLVCSIPYTGILGRYGIGLACLFLSAITALLGLYTGAFRDKKIKGVR